MTELKKWRTGSDNPTTSLAREKVTVELSSPTAHTIHSSSFPPLLAVFLCLPNERSILRMTAGPMRNSWPSIFRAHVLKPRSIRANVSASLYPTQRYLANIREPGFTIPEVWFNSTAPCAQSPNGAGDVQQPDERKLKLGKSKVLRKAHRV